MHNEGIRTFTANEAIGAKIRVKLVAGSVAVPPAIVIAGAAEQHIGMTEYAVASDDVGAVRLRTAPGTQEGVAAEAFAVGATLYAAAAGKLKDTSDGTAIGIALEEATAVGDIVEFIDFTVISTTAASVSVADAGGIITGVTVEAALAEIMVGIKTAQYTITPTYICREDGTALTLFADGAALGVAAGWTQVTSDLALRWNNVATPDDIAVQFVIPQDADVAAPFTLHLMGALATTDAAGVMTDSPTFTVEAYFSAVGSGAGTDVNCGGTSGEFLTAAGRTYQEKTLTIATTDIPANPSVLTLIMHPTDGELGINDFILLTPWLEITRKCLTS
jgi:hypothetical protein